MAINTPSSSDRASNLQNDNSAPDTSIHPSSVPMESGIPADTELTAQARGALRRRKTLTAANEVFVSRGFHATTMDEIAQRAGLSKPILYQAFSGKLELYLAVLQLHIDNLTDSVERALQSTTVNRDRVRAAISAYFDFVDDEAEGFRLVFGSEVPSEPAVQLRVGRATDTCVTAVSNVIRQDSDLDRHQARLFAVGLVGASQLAAQYWLDTGRSVPKTDAIATVVALCWGGLSQVSLRDTA